MQRLFFLCWSALFGFHPLLSAELPVAIQCYQEATHSKDIARYMACFSANPTMIDVNRTMEGKEPIGGTRKGRL